MAGVGHRHRGPGGLALQDTLQLCGARFSLVDLDLWKGALAFRRREVETTFFIFYYYFSSI